MTATSVANSPTNVTATSAVAEGVVNPDGVESYAWFEYGLTTLYGASTYPVNVGNGSSDIPVTHALAGLTPDTTYHYRLVLQPVGGGGGGGSGTLLWSPPGFSGGDPSDPANFPGFAVHHVSNASPTVPTGSGGDLYLICDEQLVNREVQIRGYRHVVSLGFESVWNFISATEHRSLKFIGNTGTVHIEGASLMGINNGLLDAMVWGGSAVVSSQIGQIQNTRVDYIHNDTGGHHSDGLQCQVGTYLTGLRLYQVTVRGTGTDGNMHGVFAKQETASDHIRGVNIQRANFVGLDHSLWQDTADIDFYTADVYVQEAQRATYTYPQPGQPIGSRVATLAGGDITFSGTNWTGVVHVEATQITPDFVPVGIAGIGYVSPGYV